MLCTPGVSDYIVVSFLWNLSHSFFETPCTLYSVLQRNPRSSRLKKGKINIKGSEIEVNLWEKCTVKLLHRGSFHDFAVYSFTWNGLSSFLSSPDSFSCSMVFASWQNCDNYSQTSWKLDNFLLTPSKWPWINTCGRLISVCPNLSFKSMQWLLHIKTSLSNTLKPHKNQCIISTENMHLHLVPERITRLFGYGFWEPLSTTLGPDSA